MMSHTSHQKIEDVIRPAQGPGQKINKKKTKFFVVEKIAKKYIYIYIYIYICISIFPIY